MKDQNKRSKATKLAKNVDNGNVPPLNDSQILAAVLTGRGKGFYDKIVEEEGIALRAKYGE